MTIARTYIGIKQNKANLEKILKLRKLILEIAEPTEENVGHNKFYL